MRLATVTCKSGYNQNESSYEVKTLKNLSVSFVANIHMRLEQKESLISVEFDWKELRLKGVTIQLKARNVRQNRKGQLGKERRGKPFYNQKRIRGREGGGRGEGQ